MFNFKRPLIDQHDWSDWTTVRETVKGPFGTMEKDAQERVCKSCGLKQRLSLEPYKQKIVDCTRSV